MWSRYLLVIAWSQLIKPPSWRRSRLGFELKIVFNKGAVMVLPPGVTKASGLEAVLTELDISSRNVVESAMPK